MEVNKNEKEEIVKMYKKKYRVVNGKKIEG